MRGLRLCAFAVISCFGLGLFAEAEGEAGDFYYATPKRHGVLVHSLENVSSDIIDSLPIYKKLVVFKKGSRSPSFSAVVLDDGSIGYVLSKDILLSNEKVNYKPKKPLGGGGRPGRRPAPSAPGGGGVMAGDASKNYIGLLMGRIHLKESFKSKSKSKRRYPFTGEIFTLSGYRSGLKTEAQLPVSWGVSVMEAPDYEGIDPDISMEGFKVMMESSLRMSLFKSFLLDGNLNWGILAVVSKYEAIRNGSEIFHLSAIRLGLALGGSLYTKPFLGRCRAVGMYRYFWEKSSSHQYSAGIQCSY